jgi:cell division protease FtsH
MVPSTQNIPLRAQRPHTPFWLGALRAGFRAYLQEVLQEELSGPVRKKVHMWDNELSDSSDAKQKRACVATVSAPSQTLNLPWMPKKPVVAELAAIAGLAQAVETRMRLATIMAPGHLTHLILPFLEEDLGEAREAVEVALELWAKWQSPAAGENAELQVLFCNEIADGGSRLPHNLKSLIGRVEKYLRAGESVILVTPGPTLPPALQRLVGQILHAPRLSQAVLVEVLRTIHAGAAAMTEDDVSSKMPPEQGLQQITLTQLQAALRLKDIDQLVSRLRVLAAPQHKGSGATLDAMRGQNDAVAHLRRMLADLNSWRDGKLTWSEASMSAVFYGPPGNGKTMLASAFAGSAGIPLHATSYSACQKAGHQGDMLRVLHEVFRQAEATVPSVLFIDEIDGFSDRSRESPHEQYLRGVVNGLLTELSHAASVPGLVLLAATNDLAVVDPAVIRPGRFDTKIAIRNPDRTAIRDILADHLRLSQSIDITDADLDLAARELIGASGAEVAARAREALGRARHARRAVNGDDLRAVCESNVAGDRAAHLRRIAVHEAGHLVVRASLDLPAPISVQIGLSGGSVTSPAVALHTEATASDALAELLAGRVAERLLLGDLSSGAGHGPESDLAKATLQAFRMEAEWGFADSVPIWQPSATLFSLGVPSAMKPAVERRLRDAESRAAETIEAHRKAVLALTEILLERRELAGDELRRVLEEVGLGNRKAASTASCLTS